MKITRRSALRALESQFHSLCWSLLARTGFSEIPLRMGFTYIPNGVIMDEWRPKETGSLGKLPESLQPLQNYTNDFQVLSGLDHTKAYANGDGGGDHARANATFLTGCQAKKTAGRDIKIGVSVDQIAADAIGGRTKLRSLELSCDESEKVRKMRLGLQLCLHRYNLSWKTESMPMVPESNPRLVFERLFGNASSSLDRKAQLKVRALNKSILDFALESAKGFNNRLSKMDQDKLDEYFSSVRELEKRIEREEKNGEQISYLHRPGRNSRQLSGAS